MLRMFDPWNPVLANLEDWPTGRFYTVRSQSEVIQWLLDAEWYNWNRENRNNITRDVEACQYVRIMPTRLGARLQFISNDGSHKRFASIFIQLFDERIMKTYLFQIRTYDEWFRLFFRLLKQN